MVEPQGALLLIERRVPTSSVHAGCGGQHAGRGDVHGFVVPIARDGRWWVARFANATAAIKCTASVDAWGRPRAVKLMRVREGCRTRPVTQRSARQLGFQLGALGLEDGRLLVTELLE